MKSKYEVMLKEEKCKFSSQRKKCKIHKGEILALTKENKKLNKELERQRGIIEGMKNAPDKKTITAYDYLLNLMKYRIK